MKKFVLSIAATPLLLGTPVAAQTSEIPDSVESDLKDEDIARMMASFSDMFTAKQMTAEQKKRLPLALAVVDKLFPEGTYTKLMEQTLEPMLESMFGVIGKPPISQLAAISGISQDEISAMDYDRLNALTQIIDPAFKDRMRVTSSVSIELISLMVEQVEPPYRAGLARAYAVRFTDDQLTELHAFFTTPTGKYYAGESMLIYSDPQVMAAMTDTMPAIMKMLPSMMTRMEEQIAALPEIKTYADLTAEQRTRFSQLIGVSESTLEKNIADF